jgi:hypothetical protein
MFYFPLFFQEFHFVRDNVFGISYSKYLIPWFKVVFDAHFVPQTRIPLLDHFPGSIHNAKITRKKNIYHRQNLPSTAHESFASSPGFTTTFSEMDLIVAPSVVVQHTSTDTASLEKREKGTIIKIHHKEIQFRSMNETEAKTYIRRRL